VTIPPLVARVRAAARELGVTRSSRDEDGRLRHVLAARRGIGRVAEIGSGTGVGTAWIAAALPPGVPLFTAETDAGRATAARAVFADDPDVHVLAGDWCEVLPPEAPFDLVFVAARDARDDLDAVLGIAAPGATLVVEDVAADRDRPDPVSSRWLDDPRLVAVEVGTGGPACSLVAVVRR
jgi:predicted O-methyltransferase YrrM